MMIYRVGLAALAILLTPLAAQAGSADDCVDTVVVAKVLRQTPTEIPDDPSIIVMRWPWMVDLEVQQVVFGREDRRDLHVAMSLHSGLNRDIEYGLFFLRKGETGRYVVVDFDYQVVADARGRFVRPMFEPYDPDEIGDWAPGDYEAWLRPIRYRHADAWWSEDQWLDPKPDEPAIATHGLLLTEMPRLLKAAGRETCAS